MICLKNVSFSYNSRFISSIILKNIDLDVIVGDYVSIMGSSGSGKSTLLNIIGCLCKPTGGSYFFENEDVIRLESNRLADIRNQKIGFIFQSFHLIQRLTVLENVELPLKYAKYPDDVSREKSFQTLKKLGMESKVNYRPFQLSGGECQRVAIARAIVNNPKIILADEPTGNLDSVNTCEVINILKHLNAQNTSIILVTHDENVASSAKRTIYIKDGSIIKNEC